MTIFEIPGGNVINLWKTRLWFQRNIVGLASAWYQFIWQNYFPYIQRVELATSNNIILCNSMYTDIYNRCAAPCVLDYTKRDQADGFLYPSPRATKGVMTLATAVATDWTKTDFWVSSNPLVDVKTLMEPAYIEVGPTGVALPACWTPYSFL